MSVATRFGAVAANDICLDCRDEVELHSDARALGSIIGLASGSCCSICTNSVKDGLPDIGVADRSVEQKLSHVKLHKQAWLAVRLAY